MPAPVSATANTSTKFLSNPFFPSCQCLFEKVQPSQGSRLPIKIEIDLDQVQRLVEEYSSDQGKANRRKILLAFYRQEQREGS